MTAASLETTRLPRQVRERVERGAAILAESQRASDGSTPPQIEPAPTPPGSPAAAPTPPQAAAVASTPTPDDPNAQPELKPFRDPALATDPRAEDPNYWRQRLSVMQGKLTEERRFYDAKEAAFKQQISELEDQIRSLKATAAPAAPVDLKLMFTPEQIEALGEDQAAAIASAAVTAARQHVDTALTERQTTAQQRQEQDAAQEHARRWREMTDQLEDVIPNWAEINKRADWIEWLGEPDPKTGRARQDTLNAATSSYNAQATAAVFSAFMQSLKPRETPPTPMPQRDAGAPPPNAPPPGADRSLTPPTQTEMKDFYKRAGLGKVSDAERVEFEKRLELL